MKEERTVKGLRSQLKNMEGDRDALKIEIGNKQRELETKQKAINEINDKIKKIDIHGVVRKIRPGCLVVPAILEPQFWDGQMMD